MQDNFCQEITHQTTNSTFALVFFFFVKQKFFFFFFFVTDVFFLFLGWMYTSLKAFVSNYCKSFSLMSNGCQADQCDYKLHIQDFSTFVQHTNSILSTPLSLMLYNTFTSVKQHNEAMSDNIKVSLHCYTP